MVPFYFEEGQIFREIEGEGTQEMFVFCHEKIHATDNQSFEGLSRDEKSVAEFQQKNNAFICTEG
jgi:hypothetical protein